MFLTFESDFINRVARKTLKQLSTDDNSLLRDCLLEMIREEESHHDIFLHLNRVCRKDLYDGVQRYFNHLKGYEELIFRVVSSFPGQLTFLYWLVLAKEEYSIAISQSMLKNKHTESLGEIDDSFIAVHREHLKDEFRHVHIDTHLIRRFRNNQSLTLRKINAWLLKQFLKDIIIPRRSSIAVLKQLSREHPELKPSERAMMRSIVSLKDDKAFQYSIFNREMMPHTFSLFDEFPEYHCVSEILPAYDPHSPSETEKTEA